MLGFPVLHYLRLMPIESVMLSNNLILYHLLSSCPQSFPASGSFPTSQLFVSGSQSIGASASELVPPLSIFLIFWRSFPGGSDSKESACNAGDLGLIPGLGRSPGEKNGYPLQYFCLENPMDRGAWQATVYGVTKSQTQLSD